MILPRQLIKYENRCFIVLGLEFLGCLYSDEDLAGKDKRKGFLENRLKVSNKLYFSKILNKNQTSTGKPLQIYVENQPLLPTIINFKNRKLLNSD